MDLVILLVVLIVLIVLLRPRTLPELGRALGETIRGFRATSSEHEPPAGPTSPPDPRD